MTSLFKDDEIEILRQLIETGVNLAADKLGQLSNCPWQLISCSVEELSVVKVLSLFYKDKSPHAAVHLKSRSLLPVELLILFPSSSSIEVTDLIVNQTESKLSTIADRQKPIIEEVGNIMGQGILRALANTLNISIILSSPIFTRGPKSKLLELAFGEFDGRTKSMILSRIDMSSKSKTADCSVLLILDVDLVRRLLKATS